MNVVQINLIPLREIRRAGRQRAQRAWALAAITLAVTTLIALSWRQWTAESELAAQLAIFGGAITAEKSDTDRAERLQEELKAYREKLSMLEAMGQPGTPHETVLTRVAMAIPDPLWLTRFALAEDTLTLEGRAADHAAIAEFLRRLESLPQFADNELVEVHRSTEDLEQPDEGFSIESRIDNRIAESKDRGTRE